MPGSENMMSAIVALMTGIGSPAHVRKCRSCIHRLKPCLQVHIPRGPGKLSSPASSVLFTRNRQGKQCQAAFVAMWCNKCWRQKLEYYDGPPDTA